MLLVRSLRFRIGAAFLLATLFTAGLVGGATYLLTWRQLTADRVSASLDQSYSTIKILQQYIETATLAGRTPAELAARVAGRGNIVIACCNFDEWSPTTKAFSLADIPEDLREKVSEGRVAYEFTKGGNRLVVGSRIPAEGSAGDAYFEYSTAKIGRSLGRLVRIFVAVALFTALASGIFGLRLARATIRPLRLAAVAARRVADGNLETRLDVTSDDELGRLATAFNEMTVALGARIDREHRFVADVSHELRTPLTSLKTSIDFLVSRADDFPEKFRGPMTLAADEVRSLQRLVDDLLELSKVDAGGQIAELDEIDLVNFAHEITRRRAPGAEVEVVGPQSLLVRTDKMRLERIVGNLLENAVHHGAASAVRIDLRRENGMASITVSDRGPGIEPEKLPMIFDRFWRGDSSRQRTGRSGAGLGLSIARENATMIGADIRVASSPGHGTSFEVLLPDDGAR